MMIKGDALILEFFMNCIPIFFFDELIVELIAVIVCVSFLFHRCCLGMCAVGLHLPVRNILAAS